MVNIVTSHGFDKGPKGHGASFGVGGEAMTVSLGDGAEKVEIPLAGRLEEIERSNQIVSNVTLHPNRLIKGLDDRVGLIEGSGESLAETKRKDEFTIGEVSNNLADAPFVRSWSLVNLLDREGSDDAAEM